MRARRPMFWLLFPRYLAIIFLSMAAVFGIFRHVIQQWYREDTQGELEALARVTEARFLSVLTQGDPTSIDTECKAMGALGLARFTLILPSGQVLGDSAENPAVMDNHAERPEIRIALQRGTGTSMRYSHTLQANMLYVAIPLTNQDDTVVGVLRVARPLDQLQRAIGTAVDKVLAGAMAVGFLAAVLSALIARYITNPMKEMQTTAERFARGDFRSKMPEPSSAELADLGQAMNRMAVELEDRLGSLTDQRNKLEGVLRSMVEGVLAVDHEEKLIAINSAAFALLDIHDDNVQGRSLQEVVRNPALHKLVAAAIAQESPVEDEISLYDQAGERFLQVHGAALHDTKGARTGAVLVLNDVTRLRRLENVRREFVANVSHELRTPITSLKAAVETLLDGAMQEPENAQRFLQIILRHADRMNAIVNDLLRLAQMDQAEKDGSGAWLDCKDILVAELLQAALRASAAKAGKKEIPLSQDCPPGLKVRCDPRLIEEAIVNLLDNAINYSERGRPVQAQAIAEDDKILISVRDQGCGIPTPHLSRIFERFYRVDKARSREQGGTGLGLAIVKHVVQAHGGKVTVESEVGKGSTFILHLPSSGNVEGPGKA